MEGENYSPSNKTKIKRGNRMNTENEIKERAITIMESGGLPEVGSKEWHQYLEKIRYYYTWMPHTLPQHIRELLDNAKTVGLDPMDVYSKKLEIEFKMVKERIEILKAMEEKNENTVH